MKKSDRQGKIRIAVWAASALALTLTAVQIMPAFTSVEYLEQIASFENTNLVTTMEVANGTELGALNLPDTLRVVVDLYGEPDMESYAADEPENLPEAYEEVDEGFYQVNGEGRIYGSLEGSANNWYACNVEGDITGVVKDIPVTWSDDGTYDKDTAGTYTVKADTGNYISKVETPEVTVIVQEGAADTEGTVTAQEGAADTEGTVTAQEGVADTEGIVTEQEDTITSFATAEPITIEVVRGTSKEEAISQLPTTLLAANKDGKTFDVPVSWKNGSEDENADKLNPGTYVGGSTYGYGPWTFTAVVDTAYVYEGDAVTAQVSISDCNEIARFCGQAGDLLMRFPILLGESVDLDISFTGAIMADGGFKNIPISIDGNYDGSVAGDYRLPLRIEGDYTGPEVYVEVVVSE